MLYVNFNVICDVMLYVICKFYCDRPPRVVWSESGKWVVGVSGIDFGILAKI